MTRMPSTPRAVKRVCGCESLVVCVLLEGARDGTNYLNSGTNLMARCKAATNGASAGASSGDGWLQILRVLHRVCNRPMMQFSVLINPTDQWPLLLVPMDMLYRSPHCFSRLACSFFCTSVLSSTSLESSCNVCLPCCRLRLFSCHFRFPRPLFISSETSCHVCLPCCYICTVVIHCF